MAFQLVYQSVNTLIYDGSTVRVHSVVLLEKLRLRQQKQHVGEYPMTTMKQIKLIDFMGEQQLILLIVMLIKRSILLSYNEYN
jgi:hypothetical protein